MTPSKAPDSIAVPATTQMETTWFEKEKGKLAGNDVGIEAHLHQN